MKNAKASESDAKKSYAFFRDIKYFEPTGKVSKKQLEQLFSALQQLGERQLPTIEQVVAPGLTELTD